MLDTRSGQLLITKSFKEYFSELKFVNGGLGYFIHKQEAPSIERIELHRLDLRSKTIREVSAFQFVNQAKTRPTLWRGSLSDDGSLLVYQSDPLKPVIEVVDGNTGSALSHIRWEEDMTALTAYIHQENQLLVIPLAHWDAAYQYTPIRKVLFADPHTGEILGKFDVPRIDHVKFNGNSVTLMTDDSNENWHFTPGVPAMTRTIVEKRVRSSSQVFDSTIRKLAGYFSHGYQNSEGYFQPINNLGVVEARRAVAPGYIPVVVRGDTLICEKHMTHQLSEWMIKINEYSDRLIGRFLFPSATHHIRYDDVNSGIEKAEFSFAKRNSGGFAGISSVPGASRLAMLSGEDKQIRIEMYEVSPFWTMGNLNWLAIGITGLAVWLRYRKPWVGMMLPLRSTTLHKVRLTHDATSNL